MIEPLRHYLLSIIGASIITAILIRITEGKGTYSSVVKLLAGILLSITVLSPVTKIRISEIPSYFDTFEFQAEDAVSRGEQWSDAQLQKIIKSQTETYIIEKAKTLNTDITVEVCISDISPYVPIAVTISGSVDPYTKQCLQKYLTDNLGISKENQVWS